MSWIWQLVLGLALSAASGLIKRARAKRQDQSSVGTSREVGVGGDRPLSFLMGTRATAGHYEYGGAWGANGSTPNAYNVDVISLSDLPIVGLTGAWIDGEYGTFDLDGASTDQGVPVEEFEADSADHLWLRFIDGTQATADTYLRDKFGSHADRPWGTDMIGRGISYVTATALINRELFSSFPQYLFECSGIPLYDPRLDTTAGGTGSHRLNDAATWEASDNPVVMIYNILLGIYYGSQWVWGYRRFRDSDGVIDQDAVAYALPYAEWAAAMNACDASVDLDAGGSEKRFRAGLEISVDQEPIDVIQALETACSARISEVAGRFHILVGMPGTAVMAITDDTLVSNNPREFEPFPGLQSTLNGVVATYSEPLEQWGAKEAPPRYSSDLEDEDDGRRLAQAVDLEGVFSGTQAQRIAETMVKEARRFRTHVVPAKPSAQVLEPLDPITWTSAQNGYSSKTFLVTVAEYLEDGTVLLSLKEVDPSDDDWSTDDELPISIAPLTPNRPASQPMSGWGVVGSDMKDDDGAGRRPTLTVSFSGPQPDVRAVAVQVRLKSSEDLVFEGETPFQSPYAVQLNGVFLPATQYEARGKYLPFSGRATTWSSWLTATTPDIGVDQVDLSTRFSDLMDWARDTVRGLEETIQDLSAYIQDQDFSNYDMVETVRTEIGVQLGGMEARVTEQINTAIGPGSALAEQINTALARANEATAGGLMKWTLKAGTFGATADFELSVRADEEGSFGQAGIIAQAISGGASRMVLFADKLLFTDGTVSTQPVIIEDGVLFAEDLRVKYVQSLDETSLNINATTDDDGPFITLEE